MNKSEYRERIKKTFADRFKKLIENSTKEKTAEALNVSESSLYKWQNPDDLTIPWKKLYSICDFYGVDPEYLLLPEYKNYTIEYDKISELTGLSSEAIDNIRKITDGDNSIAINSSDYQAPSFRKSVLNYLLSEHPDFIVDLIDRIYLLLLYSDQYNSLKDSYLQMDRKNSKKRSGLNNLKDLSSIQQIEIMNLIHDLQKEVDYDRFYEQSGQKAYYESVADYMKSSSSEAE